MPVNETLELEERAARARSGAGLDAIVVNGVLPRRFSARRRRAPGRPATARSPAPVAAAARRQHGQASVQQGQLRRLRRHTNAEVVTLPYLAGPHLGLDEVRTLADELAQRL